MKHLEMKFTLLMIFFILFFEKYNSQNPTILDAILLGPFRVLRSSITRMDARNIKEFNRPENYFRFQKQIEPSIPFPCSLENGRSPNVPNSIHKLRPGDVDIIGAIGDSITAGFAIAATNLIDIFSENRGMVYSIGGQATWREFFTLPNILKLYNPKLFGYSLGPSLSINPASQFNVAENGAVSDNIPFMTEVLIRRILKDIRTDVKNHWKFISIMIGGNDFCSTICYYKNPEEAVERHREDLLKSLRLIKKYLPRTFVSLIVPPDASQLGDFTNKPDECQVTQRFSCPCFVGSKFKSKKEELHKALRKFQMVEFEVASLPEFDHEDFTVVSQPFFYETKLPIGVDGFTDRSYFSVDCFHFSQKAHSRVAKSLWNNILEPIGEKSGMLLNGTILDNLRCPTSQRPYLATKRNS